MGFMDKVKAAAQDAATQAKTATGQAQTKLEQAQIKKKFNDTAELVGHAIYAERVKGTPSSDVDRLLAEMKELEAKLEAEASSLGSAAASQPSDAPSQVTTSSAEPTSGDFKL